MSPPDRTTRLLIALGAVLALAGLPLGFTASVAQAQRTAAAAGRTLAWNASSGALYEGDALAFMVSGAVVSAVGVVLAGLGFYRLWRSGRLLRPNEQR